MQKTVNGLSESMCQKFYFLHEGPYKKEIYIHKKCDYEMKRLFNFKEISNTNCTDLFL